MSSNHSITRRDFLNGMALGLGTGTALSPLQLLGETLDPDLETGIYPPQLTGLRGSHPGSFEVAHSLAQDGKRWPIPTGQTDETYDLVVVGGGISGLSAAMLFQQQAGHTARILVLDNHDDFGGHAKRNEFTVNGHHLIGYGGSQSIDGPGSFSAVSARLLKDLAIDTGRFYQYFDQEFYQQRQMNFGLFFNQRSFGVNRLTDNPFSWHRSHIESLADTIATFPIPEVAQRSLLNLLEGTDSLVPAEWTHAHALERLRTTSFMDFLSNHVKLPRAASDTFCDNMKDLWGLEWDSLSTLEAIRLGMPGTHRLGISVDELNSHYGEEPYIFHFPDGNAGITRALVRRLVPRALQGATMEDLVSGRLDYNELDTRQSPVRIRLNSTAVQVQHTPDGKQVDVTYIRANEAFRVRARHTIMACYNSIIPHICPEVSEMQKQAIGYARKVPLVYANIAIRNWRAFQKLGYFGFHIPKNDMFHSMVLDFPVSMGGYHFSTDPDQPILVHASMVPVMANQGLSSREQHLLGRQRLYQLTFGDFERDIFQQLDAALAPGGFDVVRDIAAITVNRWPHGYAYEYNELFDPPDWGPEKGPHIEGRAQINRISIANSDASAYAYVDGAIDAAARAVNEQLAQS